MNMRLETFTAVLLAGGRSTRMGRDKAGVILDGTPLWQRQLATLRAANPHELLISGRSDGPYAGAGLEIAPDETPGLGPLGGIATALRRMQCERLLVLAVDLPAMTADFLRDLLEGCEPAMGVVPRLDGKFEPLAAVYPRACLAVAEECLLGEDRSMQRFVRRGLAAGQLLARDIPPAARDLFRNVNTPADVTL